VNAKIVAAGLPEMVLVAIEVSQASSWHIRTEQSPEACPFRL
jgi:hypothetical protein